MGGGHIGGALRRLRGLLGAECAGGPTDGELLRRYVVAHDEAAFEALLRRHGPMVLGVCRRLLTRSHDVDDAFQATFLILLRKGRSLTDGERVGNWLYGVAYRVATRARDQASRRQARERVLIDVAAEESGNPGVDAEIRALLDEEVMRLPERYREAIVCCYLQGRTQEEAARVLGWPKGTVATRLNRARALLRRRLVRRGLGVSAGSLVLILAPPPAGAAVPPALLAATIGLGAAPPGGAAVPLGVASLADAALRPLTLTYVLKAAVAGVLAFVTVVGTGGTLARRLGHAGTAGPEGAPASEARGSLMAVSVVSKSRPAPAGAWDAVSPAESLATTALRAHSRPVLTFRWQPDGPSSASPTEGGSSICDGMSPIRAWRVTVYSSNSEAGAAVPACRAWQGQVVALAILTRECPGSANRDGGEVFRETAPPLRDAEHEALRAIISVSSPAAPDGLTPAEG